MVARADEAAKFGFLVHSHMLRHSCGYKAGQRRAGHSRDPALSRSPVDCLDGPLHRSCAGSLQGFLEGLGRVTLGVATGTVVRRGLIAPRSGSNPVHCPGIGRPVGWDDLIQPDSEQFRTVPRTQGAVAGTLDPSSGDAPRRTRGRRERDHDAPPFAKRPAVGNTGHRFPAKFLGCSG